MADLVSEPELSQYLGGDVDDPNTLQSVLTAAEDLLERATGQVFAEGATVTDEKRNGNGLKTLRLARIVASITTVKVGHDSADPDTTLTSDDVVFDGQRIVRIDGGVFPFGTANVHVTYEAADNLPEIAKMAVLEGAAFLWRRRGREHVTSETVGEFGAISVSAQLRRQPAWSAALSHYRPKVYA